MSQNTNKLFWISAIVIVFVAIGFMVYNNVGHPSNNLYNNANAETLCNSFYKEGLITCLDASSNTSEGQYSGNNPKWIDQVFNLEGKLNGFNYNEQSGWDTTALLFDGIDDSVSLKVNKTFEDRASLLINLKLPTLPDSEKEIISNNGIKIYLEPNGKVKVYINANNGTKEIESQTILEEDSWYSIMVSYDNDLLKLYINGQLDSKIPAHLGNINISQNLTIGNANMYVSSFALWDKALDTNEVNQNTIALNNKILDIDKYVVTFGYTGDCVKWYVPYEGEYQVELWGAQGGSYNSNKGGTGAFTSGNIELQEGQPLYVCVGEQGNNSGKSFNGTLQGGSQYAGGGATDVRLEYNNNWANFDSLKSRIMVAAGGGTAVSAQGGAGGMESGQNAKGNYVGILNATGGKQKNAGNNNSIKAGFNKNELRDYLVNNNKTSGFGYAYNGGGNGYFGGGGFGSIGSGAGGSSYISGHEDSIGLHAISTEDELVFTSDAHYSGYEFTSPKMESGTTEILEPTTGSKTFGKEGNGYAKITLIKTLDSVPNKTPNSKDFEVPAKVNPSVKYIDENFAEITWDDIDNVQSYECYISADGTNYKKGTVTTVLGQKQVCIFNELEQNKTHYYKVIAKNGNKTSESDIMILKTQYHTPTKAIIMSNNVSDTEIVMEFKVDPIATNYICYSGETIDSQEDVISTSINNDMVTCTSNNLTQNKSYYYRLETINGDKKSSSDIVELVTEYETPEALASGAGENETGLNTIDATFKTLTNYTDVKCYIGTQSTDVTNEINKEIYSDSVVCKADGLKEGTTYYLKTIVFNDTKSTESDIVTIKTKYQAPEKPTLINSVSTKNSIKDTYNDTNSELSDPRYICTYGTSIDDINFSGVVTESLTGEKQCEYNGLTENTTYYTRMTVRNGTEAVDSEINVVKTDYAEPLKPEYITGYLYDTNHIYAKYNIDNPNYTYKCYIIDKGNPVQGETTVNTEEKNIECRFNNLSGGEYTFYSTAENGPYKTQSDTHSIVMDDIVPTLSVTVDNSQFNSNGWAKANIKAHVKANTIVTGQVTGLAYCIDSSDCNPQFSTEIDVSGVTYTSTDSKTTILSDFENETDVYMTNESSGSKMCFQVLYGNKTTTTQCYGPYKLDKTKPTVTGSDKTIGDDVDTYDIYSGMTITDNLTTNDKITKTYDKAPTWGTDGTYTVNYTVTDLAGNQTTFTRKFIITLTDFNITYNYNSGALPSGKTNPAKYNKKTNTFTLNNPTRTGYDFKGWSGTGLTGDTNKTVTISKGSKGARSYKANWTPTNYTISYTMNGGSASNKTSYNIETADFTLNNPTRNGYTFTGWSGTGISGKSTSVKVSKGSAGNRSYTANWSVINYTLHVSEGYSQGNVTFNIESNNFCLGTPSRQGHVFDGWSGTSCINKGTTGDKWVTGTWHRYNAYDAGGVYIEVTRDGEWWSGAPNGEYGVGTNRSSAGTWEVSVPNAYQMTLNGVNTVTKWHVYRVWVYAKNNHGLLLGYNEQGLSSGKSNITVTW